MSNFCKMKSKSFSLSFLTFLLIAFASSQEVSTKAFLHFDDVYAVSISQLIDHTTPLNSLEAAYDSKKVVVTFPTPQPLLPQKTGFKESDHGIESIKSFTNHGHSHLLHYQSGGGSESLALLEIEPNGSGVLSLKHLEAIEKSSSCSGANLTVLNGALTLQLVCFSKDKKRLDFCQSQLGTKKYQCVDFDQKFFREEDLSIGSVRIRSVSQEGKDITLIYFGNAKNPNLQNVFWTFKNGFLKIHKIPDSSYRLRKIEIYRFDPHSDQAVLILTNFSQEDCDLKSIHLSQGSLVDSSFNMIREKIIGFATASNRLMFTSLENSTLSVSINNSDGVLKTFQIPEVTATKHVMIQENFGFVPFESEGSLKGVLIDFANNIHYVVPMSFQSENVMMSFSESMGRGLFLAFELSRNYFSSFAFGPLNFVQIQSLANSRSTASVSFGTKKDGELTKLEKFELTFTDFMDLEIDNSEKIQIGQFSDSVRFQPSVRANGIGFGESRIFNFETISNKALIPILNSCMPVLAAFEEENLIMGCSEGQLFIGRHLGKNNGLLTIEEEYLLEPEAYPPDFSKVASSKMYFGRFLVLLDGQGNADVIVLNKYNVKKTYKFYSIPFLGESRENGQCSLGVHGVVCSWGDKIEFHNIEAKLDEDFFDVKSVTLSIENMVHSSVSDSLFNRSFFTSMIVDRISNRLELHAWDLRQTSLLLESPRLNLNQKSRLFPISSDATFVMNYYSSFSVLVLNGSILQLPFMAFLKNFYKLVSFTSGQRNNIFAILYKSISGGLRVAVMRAAYDPTRRLVADIEVSSTSCHHPYFKIQNDIEGQNLLYFFCPDSSTFNIWEVFTDGPVFEKSSSKEDNVFQIFKQKLEFSYETPTLPSNQEPSLSAEISFGAMSGQGSFGELTPKILILPENVRRVMLKKGENIKLHQKLREVSSTFLNPSKSDGIARDEVDVEFESGELIISRQNQVLKESTEFSFRFESCKVVNWTFSITKTVPFYLCRSNIDLHYVLTNLEDTFIDLSFEAIEPDLFIDKVFLLRSHSSLFHIFFKLRDSNNFKIIAIALNSLNHPIILSNVFFSVSNLMMDSHGILNYFMTFDEKTRVIRLVFIPKNRRELLIKEVYVDNNLLSPFVERIAIESSKESVFYAASFSAIDSSSFFMYAAGNVLIHGFRVSRESQGWVAKLEKTLINPFGNSIVNLAIEFTQEYLVVASKNRKLRGSESLVVFDLSKENSSIVQTINASDFDSESFTIKDFSLTKPKKGPTKFALAFAVAPKDESIPETSKIFVKSFEIGEITLEVFPDTPETQSIQLGVELIDGTVRDLASEFSFSPRSYGLVVAAVVVGAGLLLAGAAVAFKLLKKKEDSEDAQNGVISLV